MDQVRRDRLTGAELSELKRLLKNSHDENLPSVMSYRHELGELFLKVGDRMIAELEGLRSEREVLHGDREVLLAELRRLSTTMQTGSQKERATALLEANKAIERASKQRVR